MPCSKTIHIQIIQPLIPAYRSSLFVQLSKQVNLKLKLHASKTVPGILNLVSINNEEYSYFDHPCIAFWGNRFFWQKKLCLDPEMGVGDVLVVSGNLRFLSNFPILFQAKRKRIAIIWWGHGSSKRRSKFKDIINRIVMHFVDIRLLYTDKEVEDYKQQGFPANKLFATNNAINQKPINNAILAWGAKKLFQFKNSEGITNKKILLFCGRRTGSVSLNLVYDALAQLNVNGNYFFVVIGPKEENAALKKQAEDLNIEANIRWVGPIFNQHELAPWFLSADCFVFPGPIGLSILHAFAYGLPTIVPDVVHNPEIAAFNDGQNGLFYKDGDANNLTEKISMITENPVFSNKLSEAAFQTVETKYNMDNMVNRYLAAIQAASTCVLP